MDERSKKGKGETCNEERIVILVFSHAEAAELHVVILVGFLYN